MPLPLPDDTDLDAIASQVRSYKSLSEEEIETLLADARASSTNGAKQKLMEHQLVIALAAAMQRGNRGVDVADLFQDATLAVVAAVNEYVESDRPGVGLRDEVAKSVDAHLEATIARYEAIRKADEAIVEDAKLVSAARVYLRTDLGRDATVAELAKVLKWEEARVDLVDAAVAEAQAQHDLEIFDYLDDVDDQPI